jgi:hypothetical protein
MILSLLVVSAIVCKRPRSLPNVLLLNIPAVSC